MLHLQQPSALKKAHILPALLWGQEQCFTVCSTAMLYLAGNLSEITNNWGNSVPFDHLLSNEASSTRIGLHLIELLTKGGPWEALSNPGCCQDYMLIFTEDKIPFLKRADTYIEPSFLCATIFARESTLPKEICKHQPSHKHFDLWCLACKLW